MERDEGLEAEITRAREEPVHLVRRVRVRVRFKVRVRVRVGSRELASRPCTCK